MIRLERGEMPQPNGTQRGTHHAPAGGQDGADQQHLDMTPHRAREQRRERRQECDNVCGEEQHVTTSWLKWSPAYSSPLHTSKWIKSELQLSFLKSGLSSAERSVGGTRDDPASMRAGGRGTGED